MPGDRPKIAHIFGPVPSRRLGRSLGVDVVPRKTCTLDCIYCQVGRTTDRTTERRSFVPVETVLEEIGAKLADSPRPDYITLSGSGEPTLYADLGELIRGIRKIADVPVAILTNGTLLTEPDVRAACALADVVLPSLDAGDEAMFQRINRPAPGLTLEGIVAGMAAFREEYQGRIWLEVFLVEGLNDSEEHVRSIARLAARIRPDKVQLNTAVRPTAEPGVMPVPEERLRLLARLFTPPAEVIADFPGAEGAPSFRARAEDVLEMVRRRPVTLDDIAAGLGIHPNEAAKYVADLLRRGSLRKERRGGRDFFRAAP